MKLGACSNWEGGLANHGGDNELKTITIKFG